MCGGRRCVSGVGKRVLVGWGVSVGGVGSECWWVA